MTDHETPPRPSAHAHVNAHAHEHDPHEHDPHEHEHEHVPHEHVPHEHVPHEHDQPTSSFPHEKLDVYRVALEMASLANDLALHIPRGHRSVGDHLLRAASNSVLLYAEGANRRGAREKRQRFVESRGECSEVAAAADLILVLNIGDRTKTAKMKALAGRASAMLTKLVARVDPTWR